MIEDRQDIITKKGSEFSRQMEFMQTISYSQLCCILYIVYLDISSQDILFVTHMFISLENEI